MGGPRVTIEKFIDRAKQNKYKLLRIPYNKIKDIDQILTNSLLKESNGANL